jgi:hypothetical protein
MLVDVSPEVTCPNPLLRSDAAVLVGVLAVLEGFVRRAFVATRGWRHAGGFVDGST